jgi:hypothetical protein
MLVLAVLLPALALSVALAMRLAVAERARLEDGGRNAAAALAEVASRELAVLRGRLEALAADPALAAGDLAAFHAAASRLRDATGVQLFLTDAEAGHLMNTRLAWGAPLPLVTAAATYRRAAAGGQPLLVSPVVAGAIRGAPSSASRCPRRSAPPRARRARREHRRGPPLGRGGRAVSGRPFRPVGSRPSWTAAASSWRATPSPRASSAPRSFPPSATASRRRSGGGLRRLDPRSQDARRPHGPHRVAPHRSLGPRLGGARLGAG